MAVQLFIYTILNDYIKFCLKIQLQGQGYLVLRILSY